jgi:hypothetical protein
MARRSVRKSLNNLLRRKSRRTSKRRSSRRRSSRRGSKRRSSRRGSKRRRSSRRASKRRSSRRGSSRRGSSRRASKRRSSRRGSKRRRSSRRASKLTSLKDIQNIAIKHHVVYKGKSKNKLTETLCNVTGARHPSNNRRGMTKKEMLMIGPYISNKKLINIVNCKKAYQKLIK